jgi:hypothetical protein
MSNYEFISDLVDMWSKIHKNKKTVILYYLLSMDKYDNPQCLNDYYKRNIFKILGDYELKYSLPNKEYGGLLVILNKYVDASECYLDDINEEIIKMDETITRYEKKEDLLLYER